MSKLSNWVYKKTLKAYILPLAGCGGCDAPLEEALSRLPVKLVTTHEQADLIFFSGVITTDLASALKKVFATLAKPFFIIQIGQCMGKLNKSFENPDTNYAVYQKNKKFFPIDKVIGGCPPTADEIFDSLETFLTYLDIAPEITKTLTKRIDKTVLNP